MLISLIVSWVIATCAFMLAATILPGVQIRGWKSAIVAAALYGVFSFLLSWLLWGVFAIATLGIAVLLAFIFKFLIAAIILKLVDVVMSGLHIRGFLNAIFMALIVAGITSLAEWALRNAGVINI